MPEQSLTCVVFFFFWGGFLPNPGKTFCIVFLGKAFSAIALVFEGNSVS